MKLWKMKISTAFAAFGTALLIAGSANAEKVNFVGYLSPDNEVTTPVDLDEHEPNGMAEFTFDDETKILCGKISYDDLTGPPTGIHVHQAPKGMPDADGAAADKVIIPIPADATGAGEVSFKVKLPDAWATSLANREIYSNVHTSKNTKGEIRGSMESNPDAEGEVECPDTELKIGAPQQPEQDAGAPPPDKGGTPPSSGGPSGSPGGGNNPPSNGDSAPLQPDNTAAPKDGGGCNTGNGSTNVFSLGLVAGIAVLAARVRRKKQ